MSTLRSRSASCQPSSSLVDRSGCSEPAAGQPGLPLSVTGCSIRPASPARRRKRTMTPTDKKDSTYWDKRLKNNEAARRSREKRRLSDLMREGQLLALSEENTQLRACVLSLHYHTSVNAGRSKSASPAGATLTSSVVAPTLSLSPRYPSYFQAGHWVNSGHQENRSCETEPSCFGTNEADGEFKGTHSFATSPLEGQRPAEAEKGPHRHFFYSDDNFTHNYYIRAFLRNASTHTPHSWLEPHLSSSAVCNSLLLPWRPSYVPPPTIVYPGLPHYIQERQSQSWFSFAGPGQYLSPNGH